jgi:DNA-binding response OmpR family regulator
MASLRDNHGLVGIALSGYGMDEDLRRSREAGFVAHLVKPIDIQQLRFALKRIANRNLPLNQRRESERGPGQKAATRTIRFAAD